ncbi:hypothetical protein ACLB2K_035388 [Fragaria x ananassa]
MISPSRRYDTDCHLPRLVEDAPSFKSIPSTPPSSAGRRRMEVMKLPVGGEAREREERVRGVKMISYLTHPVCNSDELESLVDSETEEDEEGNLIKMPTRLGKMKLYPYIRFVGIRNPSFRLKLLFPNVEQLREVVRECAIRNQISMWFEKNTKKKMQVRCQWSCPFYMYASNVKKLGPYNMVVKTLIPYHLCSLMETSHFLTYRRVAQEVKDKLLVDEDLSRKGIHKHIEDTYNMDVPMQTVTRGKRAARKMIEAHHIEQYNKLAAYRKELLRSNHGSTVEIMTEMDEPVRSFKRMYICFNEIFPIAYAVVERESEETWTWFLEFLQQDVKIERDNNYVFMTDKQKGLDNALKVLFPNAEHQHYVWHLHNNFKQKHSGRGFKAVDMECRKEHCCPLVQQAHG